MEGEIRNGRQTEKRIGCACVLSAKMCSTTLGALSMDWKKEPELLDWEIYYILLWRIETFCCEHPLLLDRRTPINCLSSHLFFISLRLRPTTVTNAATTTKAITRERQQSRLKNCKEVDTNVCCHLPFFVVFAVLPLGWCQLHGNFLSSLSILSEHFLFISCPARSHTWIFYIFIALQFFAGVDGLPLKWNGKMTFQRKQRRVL